MLKGVNLWSKRREFTSVPNPYDNTKCKLLFPECFQKQIAVNGVIFILRVTWNLSFFLVNSPPQYGPIESIIVHSMFFCFVCTRWPAIWMLNRRPSTPQCWKVSPLIRFLSKDLLPWMTAVPKSASPMYKGLWDANQSWAFLIRAMVRLPRSLFSCWLGPFVL